MNFRFKINDDIARIDKNLIDQLGCYPAANIGDILNRVACISNNVRPLNKHKLCGPAYTVKTVPGDNLMLYYALDNALPGDIIVIDGGGYDLRALCGEIMISYAVKKQIAGIIVYGAVRDVEALKEMPIPIYSSHVSPNGPYKNGPGEINVPIVVDGLVVNPGDILVGNQDGIVIVKQEEVEEVLSEVKQVEEKERRIMKDIEENCHLDMEWMYEQLRKNNVSFKGGK